MSECSYEGQRCPAPEQMNGFVVCDKGRWLFMHCAPGTAFSGNTGVCVDPTSPNHMHEFTKPESGKYQGCLYSF